MVLDMNWDVVDGEGGRLPLSFCFVTTGGALHGDRGLWRKMSRELVKSLVLDTLILRYVRYVGTCQVDN